MRSGLKRDLQALMNDLCYPFSCFQSLVFGNSTVGSTGRRRSIVGARVRQEPI